MHFIWLLVGMPLFCAVYGVYLARKNRIEEEGRSRGAVSAPRKVVSSGSAYREALTSNPRLDSNEHRKRVVGGGRA